MIIPEKKLDGKSLDYMEGFAAGIHFSLQTIHDGMDERTDFVKALDEAWYEAIGIADEVMDKMENDLNKDSDKREIGT